MAELDYIAVHNPRKEPMEVTYNGEKYAIEAETVKPMQHHLARHMAKHATDKWIGEDVVKEQAKFRKKKELMPEPLIVQWTMYDCPKRRNYLYEVLRSKEEVERTIKAYPQFKATDAKLNFVGEMKDYDDFVIKYEADRAPKEPKVKKEETPKEKAPIAKKETQG